ncbi:MAG: hypothetical protein ACRD0F_01485 [Acidimicrobiales bacterium]
MTLIEQAAAVARFAHLERGLFEALGGWVATVPEPEVKLHLATHSRRHAWHADLCDDLLPAASGLDRPSGEPPPAVVALFGAVAAPTATLERLVGAYRVVLPRLLATYDRHCRRANPASDGPMVRALQRISADEVEEWRAGEAMVQECVREALGVRRAADHQVRLEEMFLNTTNGSRIL